MREGSGSYEVRRERVSVYGGLLVDRASYGQLSDGIDYEFILVTYSNLLLRTTWGQ